MLHGQVALYEELLVWPVCRATVTYPAEGYAAMFGWTQMVCSTDSAPDRFEMDPIALYQQIPTPYAWFGVRPSYSMHQPAAPGTSAYPKWT